jgi:hypothetical protein
MSESRGFKSLHEIFADREKRYEAELTAYQAAGWTLVDIHHRDYRDPDTGEQVKVQVYIMGHSDPDVILPKWGDAASPSA